MAGNRKRRDSGAVVLAVVSDLHCGSTIGLMQPELALDDGQTIRHSRAQAWLWDLWGDFWRRVEAKRREEAARLFVVLNGDAVDGDHHGTTQIVSRNAGAEKAILRATLEVPKALRPERWFVVRGTEAHVGKAAAAEESIAKELGAEGDPATGTASWWHLRMEVAGVRIDCAHHGRMGTRPWTKHTGVGTLAAQIFYEHAANGDPWPHLAIRSHYHRFADSGSLHPVRVVQTGAWQLATSFVHKVAPDTLADIGGLIVTCRDGAYAVEPVLSRPSRGHVWKEGA